MSTLYGMVASTEPTTVLEAGCGEGFVLNYIAQQNPELKLTGLDYSEDAVQYAREHFGGAASFRQGDIYKLPYSDRSFDTVICSEVLEHLAQPDKAVRELKRVARKAVVISVPREPYFQWLSRAGQVLGISPDPEHVNFWNKNRFQSFIKGHFEDPRFAWKHIYQLAVAEL